MIVRIWRARVDPQRIPEYERFALNRSLPMFRRQQGFIGVFFTRRSDDVAVITLWKTSDDVAALQESTTYSATAAALEMTRLVTGDTSVETLGVDGGEFYGRALDVASPNGR